MSRSSAMPRYETMRTASRPTFGHRVAAIAEKLGQPFMPWQKQWALVAGEMVRDDETGVWVPAYPEAFATLPRQQGKTLWILAEELDRALLWSAYDRKPQSIAYTGQTGLEARKKFKKEHVPLIRHSALWAAVQRPRYAAEDTGLDFKNGAILTIWANSEESGHGAVIDMAVMDEIWADADNRREQAATPAMATRHDRQKLIVSTAGTDASTLYLSKQSAGRVNTVESKTTGIAYLEFGADPDADPEDPATWRSCMPALGYTISERTVRTALEEMKAIDPDLVEFRRAWLNITKRASFERVIPPDLWAAACDPNVAPAAPYVIGLDGTPNQSAASIVVADAEGRVELVDHRDGTSWAVERTVGLAADLNAKVVVHSSGPVGNLIPALRAADVDVVEYGTREVVYASAEFVEHLADRHVRVRPTVCQHCGRVPLTVAVEGATRLPVGDGWRWARKSTDVDISPLMAATLAVGLVAGIGGDMATSVDVQIMAI